jgi:serine/threonine protein kinase
MSTVLVAALDAAHVHEVRYVELSDATGGFAKERVLGKGSFADVYLGELRGQEVAVKVETASNECNDAEAAMLVKTLEQQFASELTCLYQYRHPNICALLHHSIDGPTRCLVYEYW